ncbi:Peptidase aspartic putative domain-containing protein [Camponotus japonicus]
MDLADLLSDQMQDFDSLKRQIEQIASLIQNNKPSSVLSCREGYMKHLWIKCQHRNSQTYRIATDEEKKALTYFTRKEFVTMENLIFEAFDSLAERLAELQPRDVPAATPPMAATSLGESHVRLARIEIPKFSGKQTEWQSYRDTFTALVKNNRTYDNVTKLWHLRTSLDGEAFDLISTMDVTNANFEVAWDLLVRQYNNTIALTNAHLNALFAIDPIKKESPALLRNLRNSITKHLGALKQLGRNTDGYDDILINRAVVLLDSRTKRDWELSLTSKTEYPKFDDLDKFLLARIQVLESLGTSSSELIHVNNQMTSKSETKFQSSSIKSHLASTTENSCQLCKENHKLFKCEKFKQISPTERFDLVKTHKWCINCLKPNHKVTDCKSDKNCYKCQKRHHTWLHRDVEIKSKDDNSNATQQLPCESGMQIVNKSPTLSHLSCSTTISHTNIQLGTARVWCLSPSQRAIRVRALIDPGSTWSFISHDLARALGVKTERISESLSGVGESNAGPVSSAAHIRISANHHGHSSVHTTTMILQKITSYKPQYTGDLSSWSHLSNLEFADDFFNDDPIHVLIGANLYGAFLLDGVRKDKIDEPIAQKTIFGCIW